MHSLTNDLEAVYIGEKGVSREWVRLLNYAVMIFGHCIIIWFPDVWYLRLGDYFCYPIFAYLVAVGLKKTTNPSLYLSMMGLMAIISQFPFEYAGVGLPGKLNIMYALFCSAGITYVYIQTGKIFPIILGLAGSLAVNMLTIAEGILIMYATITLYEYLPNFKKGNLKISKYWLYSIYPGHLLILGVLRRLI